MNNNKPITVTATVDHIKCVLKREPGDPGFELRIWFKPYDVYKDGAWTYKDEYEPLINTVEERHDNVFAVYGIEKVGEIIHNCLYNGFPVDIDDPDGELDEYREPCH